MDMNDNPPKFEQPSYSCVLSEHASRGHFLSSPILVMDMNDNPPKFEQPSYSCVLSEHASRGQFVTVVSASDPDYIDHDRLVYTIAQGNELQTYGIDPVTGIITLVNMQNFAEKHVSILNVSVTDGVYTSFTRVKITILPANLHNPVFEHMFYDAKVDENQLAGRLVTTVSIHHTEQLSGVYP
uniref:Cadherin domain-containing protein n=1 Tax=Anopheles maculatus TaxID=74869 RepID=A0A182T0X5_9DIPT